jgi:hypothetical protein
MVSLMKTKLMMYSIKDLILKAHRRTVNSDGPQEEKTMITAHFEELGFS